MNTYVVSTSVPAVRVDETVLRLRRIGFVAYTESSECGRQFYIVTDAPRAAVLIEAGHGLFLS